MPHLPSSNDRKGVLFARSYGSNIHAMLPLRWRSSFCRMDCKYWDRVLWSNDQKRFFCQPSLAIFYFFSTIAAMTPFLTPKPIVSLVNFAIQSCAYSCAVKARAKESQTFPSACYTSRKCLIPRICVNLNQIWHTHWNSSFHNEETPTLPADTECISTELRWQMLHYGYLQ